MNNQEITAAVQYEVETYTRRVKEAREAFVNTPAGNLTGYATLEWLIKSEALLKAWTEAVMVAAHSGYEGAIEATQNRLIYANNNRSSSAVADAMEAAFADALRQVLRDLRSMTR